MKLVTKNPNSEAYYCKLIDFTHNNIDRPNTVEIMLMDGSVKYIDIEDINHIAGL